MDNIFMADRKPIQFEEYLKYDRILACGGSWMVKGDLIKAGKFDEIQQMTKDAAEMVKRIRG